jgi:Fe-S oxidoreductase
VFQPPHASLAEYFKGNVWHAFDKCILCCKCVSNCLVFLRMTIKDTLSEKIIQRMIDFLKDGLSPGGVYLKAVSCSGCSYRADSSPQEIDPMLIHEAAKIELVEQGKRSSEANHPVFPKEALNPLIFSLPFKRNLLM